MTTALGMIVPTRGRPESVARMGHAWEGTGAHKEADLWWIVDADDPTVSEYKREIEQYEWMHVGAIPRWMPMVPKLNWAARQLAEQYHNLGFMGDDHVPRSTGWAVSLAAALEKTGIVYGRDGFQDKKLPTWWAMSSSIVMALDRMVPARVQHLYCDNAIMQLGEAAEVLTYLPDVLIEHMHPAVGKAEWSEGHIRVNRAEQYARDRLEFEAWMLGHRHRDVTLVRSLLSPPEELGYPAE